MAPEFRAGFATAAVALAAMLVSIALPLAASAAEPDNDVEWNGLSHIDWLDRRPLCPVDGEAFDVRFQAYRDDLTAARVFVDNGSLAWVDAVVSHRRGPYDVWSATIPATAAAAVEYFIAVTDGTDTDYLGPGGVSDNPPAAGWVVDHLGASHAPVGATLTSDGGAAFKVWVNAPTWFPQGDWVAVRGSFNGWGCTPLASLGGGWYAGRAPSVTAGDNYKYYFWDDACQALGANYHEDARYRLVNRADHDNSVVVDPLAYAWKAKDFTPPPFEELVIYELHVGTFSGYNDGLNRFGRYRDVVDRHLGHLIELGVNAVELMPITEFDGYLSWGYNPVNGWAPEESYGTPGAGGHASAAVTELKYLIDRLHQAGIAVILDVVYNHVSPTNNYLWEYGDTTYFDRDGGGAGCDTPWGAQAALWRPEVRDYYADNILYWLEEYGVDGFRLDATRWMRDGAGNGGCYAEGAALMQRINDSIDRRNVHAISIAEELPDSTWITAPTSGGAGFDAQWHDQYKWTVRGQLFTAARGGDAHVGAVADALNAWGYDNATLVRYVESHDEAGGDSDDDRRLAVSLDAASPNGYWARAWSKMGQGLTILAPGIPMFLQGGEWLEDRKFDAGWNNRLDWAKAAARPQTVRFFRDVIAVRKANCGLRADAPTNVFHVNEAGNVIAFGRGAGSELVVIANFSGTDYDSYNFAFPRAGTWVELLNSQAVEYGGNGWGNGGAVVAASNGAATITIPEAGLLVFRHESVAGRTPDLTGDGRVDLADVAALQVQGGDFGCGRVADVQENGRIDRGDLDALSDAYTGP